MNRHLYSLALVALGLSFLACGVSSTPDEESNNETSMNSGPSNTSSNNTNPNNVAVPELEPYEWQGGDRVVELALGTQHSCALFDGGGVKCWGSNFESELGVEPSFEDAENFALPVRMVPTLGAGVAQLSASDGYTCALMSDGEVRCWGANAFGNFGRTDPERSARPLPVDNLGQAVTRIVAGPGHACAILGDGAVACFGSNDGGNSLLGNVRIDEFDAPVQVVGMEREVIALSVSNKSCALMQGGRVKCWGGASPRTVINPLPQTVPSWHDGVTSLAVGLSQFCALRAGSVSCFGDNESGELGVGSEVDQLRNPTPMRFQRDSPTQIVAGDYFTCVRYDGGEVECVGINDDGQLGDGTTSSSNLLVEVELSGPAVEIAAGARHACAVLDSGSVECWGHNFYGTLGDGTTTASSTPVAVQGLDGGTGPEAFVDAPEFVAAPEVSPGKPVVAKPVDDPWAWRGGEKAVSITLGLNHSCALFDGGGLKCWGDSFHREGGFRGSEAELGEGGSLKQIANFTAPVLVPRMNEGVTMVGANDTSMCAIKQGTLGCWGDNVVGQLGRSEPTQHVFAAQEVRGIEGVPVQFAGSGRQGCARTDAGELYCWGRVPVRTFGMYDFNDMQEFTFPTKIEGLRGAIEEVVGRSGVMCAMFSGGAAQCWNRDGETFEVEESVTHMDVSESHVCVVQGGGVFCTGDNDSGQLGDGTTNRTFFGEFVQVRGLPGPAKFVATMAAATLVFLEDGRLFGVGRNEAGQLGTVLSGSDTRQTTTPVEIGSLGTGIIQLEAGSEHACALRQDGVILCWGRDTEGQVGIAGDGDPVFAPTEVIGL